MGLGGYPALSLADAREKVAACRRSLANGGDPFATDKLSRKLSAKLPKPCCNRSMVVGETRSTPPSGG
jgi:hypothetical protein